MLRADRGHTCTKSIHQIFALVFKYLFFNRPINRRMKIVA